MVKAENWHSQTLELGSGDTTSGLLEMNQIQSPTMCLAERPKHKAKKYGQNSQKETAAETRA